MKYKVTFNVPKQEPVELIIGEDKIQALMEAVNQKQVAMIDDSFYNTAYFVSAEKIKSPSPELLARAKATREKLNQELIK